MKLFALVFCSLLATFSSAHEGPTDGFGCHSAKSGTYHCHTGPLAGRNFVNKAAAVKAMIALEQTDTSKEEPAKPAETPKTQIAESPAMEAGPAPASVTPVTPATPVPPKADFKLAEIDPLKVISWHAPKMGKENLNYHHVAPLIAIADLVILEDLSLTDLSREGLNQLASALSSTIGEKICRAIVMPSKDAKSRAALLWKDRKLAFVRGDGRFRESCRSELKITDRRSLATVFVKHASQFVTIAPVTKDSDIAAVFAGLSQNQWPALVAGDFNAEYAHASLKPLRDQHFIPALPDARAPLKSVQQRDFQKTRDNFWARGLASLEARVVDLYAEYPDLDVDQIRLRFSDRLPIYTELRFALDDENPDAGKRLPTSESDDSDN